MNLIRIAGHVVNMDNVLYVEYGTTDGGGYVRFNFGFAIHTTDDTHRSDYPSWHITGDDAKAFIAWLEANSVDVTKTSQTRATPI